MTTWDSLFSPVMALGRESRTGQTLLGQAIIDAIANRTNLVAEAKTGTGKSFAALIPMIDAVHKAKAKGKKFRGAVSTETITLQTQLMDKDLPFLHKLYGGFTYKKLMGRSNYVCFAHAKLNVKGDAKLEGWLQTLKTRSSDLGNGEIADVARVLHKEVEKEDFAALAGSSKFCGDNQCSPDICWSQKAREAAMKADIIVVNHAILVTDVEMKLNAGGGAFSDGLLGNLSALIVDEAHSLEPVLVDQWTKEITDWELQNMITSVNDGYDTCLTYKQPPANTFSLGYTLEGVQEVLSSIQKFHERLCLKNGEQWKKYSQALAVFSMSKKDALYPLMDDYEVQNPLRLKKAQAVLENAIPYMKDAATELKESKGSGLRAVNKGIRAAKDLLEACRIMEKALSTKDGIVQEFGIFGCGVSGWNRRDGGKGMTLRLVPLDVSTRAKALWQDIPTCALISATLADLTDGSFKYARRCVGFPDGAPELRVDSPFDMSKQAVVYVTSGEGEQAEKGVYSFEEMVESMHISKGRALALFTSREELDWAAEKLLNMFATGEFPYPVYVQETDSNKDKLAANFKANTSSVLLATRSFFTGFDAPGETLSNLIICKFPMPRLSTECRQQMKYWRSEYPNWYQRKALTDWEQGVGRLIRSMECRGVVTLLDRRTIDKTSNINITARMAVRAVGSPVVRDFAVVEQFLDQKVPA